MIDPVICFYDQKFLIFRNICLYISAIWLLFTSYRSGGAELSEFPVCFHYLPGKVNSDRFLIDSVLLCASSVLFRFIFQDSETCTLLYRELFFILIIYSTIVKLYFVQLPWKFPQFRGETFQDPSLRNG